MRDNQILERQMNDAKRITMIYRQMVFIDTRLQAMESVFKKLSWFERIFLNQEALFQRIDKLHFEVMRAHDEQLKQANEEQKAKPKLTIVAANGAIQ